jgi:thiamine-monophosphate kinase
MLAGRERELALGCMLAGGDDYELCFTASPAMRERVDAIALALALPLTPIGTITVDPLLTIRDEHGGALDALPRAFDHFGQGR